MSSRIFGHSKPKNVVKCENCNESILFYQERICNLGEKIPYGQDGKPHHCPNKPADEELRCFCQRSVQQCWESEPNHVQTLESATQTMQAIRKLKTEMRVGLDHVSQRFDRLLHQEEKFQYKGGVQDPNVK